MARKWKPKPEPKYGKGIKCRIGKRKYLIQFGYIGTGYKGMQLVVDENGQETQPSIESELMKALKIAGLIDENIFGSLGKVLFSRAARTDAGVHAASQCVAMRLMINQRKSIKEPIEKRKSIKEPIEKTTNQCAESTDNDLKDANMENKVDIENNIDIEIKKDPDTKLNIDNELTANDSNNGYIIGDMESKFSNLDKKFLDEAITIVRNLVHCTYGGVPPRDIPEDEHYIGLLLASAREMDAEKSLIKALPDNFTLHRIQRVPNSFDARIQADGRHYEYLFPSWILNPVQLNTQTYPELQLDHNMSQAAMKYSISEYTRFIETLEYKERFKESLIDSMLESTVDTQKAYYNHDKLSSAKRARKMAGTAPPVVPIYMDKDQLPTRPLYEDNGLISEEIRWPKNVEKLDKYRTELIGGSDRFKYILDDNDIQRFKNIIKQYEGSHSFLNFTSRMEKNDPKRRRYMKDIEVEIFDNGSNTVQLVIVRLYGQSFLLNQIRKMIGLAIEVYRGSAPEWAIQEAFSDNNRFVPMAPAEGLLLDMPCYTSFNNTSRCEIPNFPICDRLTPIPKCKENIYISDENPLKTPLLRLFNYQDTFIDSVDTYKRDIIYTCILKTVEVNNNEELADLGRVWSEWMVNMDWHPYVLENFPYKPHDKPALKREPLKDNSNIENSKIRKIE